MSRYLSVAKRATSRDAIQEAVEEWYSARPEGKLVYILRLERSKRMLLANRLLLEPLRKMEPHTQRATPAEAAIDARARKAQRRTPGLSYEQAVTKVLNEAPNLYASYLQQREDRLLEEVGLLENELPCA